ncbi:MAG: homoserine kinase [Ilumatobacteraceae bacterium]
MTLAVRTPASSANLGPGFDVLGLALALYADLGIGEPPEGAVALDEHHPAVEAFERLGGQGPVWLRSSIPMARGLGFSGTVRVGGAALAVCQRDDGTGAIPAALDEILSVAVELEGHGDNAAASAVGGLVAFVGPGVVPIRVGPTLAASTVVTWIPDVTTSTDSSRLALSDQVARSAAVHNIGRALQLAAAFEQDDPSLLPGATSDRLHQQERLARLPGATDAIEAGVAAGAWCGWLSGSGPTVALLCPADAADAVVPALRGPGHCKQLSIDTGGTRLLATPAAG